MKKIKVFTIFFLVVTFLAANTSFAAEKTGSIKARWRKFLGIFKRPSQEEAPAPVKSALDKLPKEEILRRIKYMLETSPQIEDFIPGLKDVELEKLDKEELIKIYSRVNIERIRIQTDRIQKQLESIKASERISEPRKIYTPPATRSAPKPPPSPPKVQKPAPSPPQSPRR